MFARRLTCLFTSKISRPLTCTRVRQIHFLASNLRLQSNHDSCDKTSLNRFQANILQNNRNNDLLCTCKRHKSRKKKKQLPQDEESDEEEWDDETDGDPNSKPLYIQVGSTRVDLIIKSCLGMARNKVEYALYDSKIRVNGEKVLKKSQQICVGDIVDVVRGPSPKNPDFLVVSRITILSASSQEDSIRIKYTKDKSLLIENYDDEST
ncbi:mitochondrial transcription rescue factor 1 [Venturia canescens]|uniref:mitochondrial transcription rescue factor 1 n=1 Tax=Venturia canescens TaxID=32260 RepID=UPI001C9C2571|nr:mitochondrial transcription rescue factor 1 [Venturia canescens]